MKKKAASMWKEITRKSYRQGEGADIYSFCTIRVTKGTRISMGKHCPSSFRLSGTRTASQDWSLN